MKAVLRYSGVAYDALRYKNLDKKCQKYIDDNVFVFSNLFGFIRLGDEIPNYKIKQGEKIGDFRVEKFYNEEFSPSIDKFLENSEIIDLRASFYENFYTIKQPYITFKFIKNGKVVSHFAKHYRGETLRQIAIANLQNLNELGKINFQNLQLIDIKKIKHKEEYLFEIL
ncbi:peroxide stress protein YaaA [Campylobacter sputorum]|uniref:peroxide stress protein YaaA n=1 Tax=Campylobacter sputorum TaxID=206 RepID=UPI00286979BF|nr:peroxide stress protein YaaA [Campylobacter sputorum]